MKITDEMIEVANRAVIEKRGYKYPGLFTDEELRIGRENMKVALEAAFAAVPAEPVAWRHRISGTEKWGVSIEGDHVLRNARRFAEQYPENAEIEPLYAAPSAPAVVVKPLEWREILTHGGRMLSASSHGLDWRIRPAGVGRRK